MGAYTKLITYEDSLNMPENRLEEIVHGESRIMPTPTPNHSAAVDDLGDILKSFLDSRQYRVFISNTGLGIERVPLTYRAPDLMVFRKEQLRQSRAQTAANDPYIWTVPDLLVECLSPSNRKGAIHELLADYERVAVPEVWLLDPAVPQCTQYRYESGALREGQIIHTGIITPLLLPSVNVDLDAVWTAFTDL